MTIILIDHNKISKKDNSYQGHFVVVTGFDAKYIYFHESGHKITESIVPISKQEVEMEDEVKEFKSLL